MRFSPPLVASLVVCGACSLSLPAAAQYRVAVVTAGQGSSQEAADQLNDDTFFDFTATLVTPDDIDTALELMAFDVVVWGDSGHDDAAWTLELATAVKTWSETNGGGVVSTSWVPYALDDNAIDLAMDDLTPIDGAPDEVDFWCSPPDGSTPLEVTVTNAHPIVDGLTSISTTSSFVNYSPLTPDGTNVTIIGEIANPVSCNSTAATYPAIVAGELGTGLVAYVGFLYQASTTTYSIDDVRNGDRDQLFEQAVHWAAGNSDTDGDTVLNAQDNCPFVVNTNQDDNDLDGAGDECDDDDDNDTVLDVDDNCPFVANTNQVDTDLNGVGDACEPMGTGGMGGTAGMGGMGGSGMGGATGGMGGDGGSPPSPTGSGGMGVGGTSGSSGGAAPDDDDTVVDDGCSCAVVGGAPASSGLGLAALAVFAGLTRRRRRRA